MFEISIAPDNVVHLSGRLDAAQADKADEVLKALDGSVVADLSELTYISSMGIAVLVKTLKRLTDEGNTIRLVNVNQRVKNVFKYAGLHDLFGIT